MSGLFVTVDGPGGAGKSTTTRLLGHLLAERGYAVHTTTEPSHGQLGEIARHGTDVYSGYALACLVAADRYHHLATEIRPSLMAGHIVVCDRYVASSYVLQRMDGVSVDFIEAINAQADIPDLAVVLTAHPHVTADRIERRGAHNRFEADADSGRLEAELYTDTIARLTERSYPLFVIDTGSTPISQVVELVADKVAELAGVPRTDSSTA